LSQPEPEKAPTQATQPSTADPADANRPGFSSGLLNAYLDDWKGRASTGPEPRYRGCPPPLSSPPYPREYWPYGGSPTIGAPDTMATTRDHPERSHLAVAVRHCNRDRFFMDTRDSGSVS
jgi:hypothetical protein